jgi:hypothetical protein
MLRIVIVAKKTKSFDMNVDYTTKLIIGLLWVTLKSHLC